MRYFERRWDESRGDANGAWGGSWWYFEADDTGAVSRQIEVYDRRPTLRYDEERDEDEFGGLSEVPLDLDDFAEFEISAAEFEEAWGRGG